MKNKGDFIIDLLSNKNLSTNDRERILKLSAKELEKSSETQDEIQLILEEFEKSNINFKSKIEDNIEEIKSGKISVL